MEFSLPMFWLIMLVVLLIIEALTAGLTTIWFAAGAFLTMLLSLISAPLWLQIVVFLAVSTVLLIFTRPIAQKYFNSKKTKTNSEGLIGRKAKVTERISNLEGTGAVLVDGLIWSARTDDDMKTIDAGALVVIKRIEGVKAIVKEV